MSCSVLSNSDSALSGDVFWAMLGHSLCLSVCIYELRGNFWPEGGEIFKGRPVGSLPFPQLGWLATLFIHQTSLLPGKIGQ